MIIRTAAPIHPCLSSPSNPAGAAPATHPGGSRVQWLERTHTVRVDTTTVRLVLAIVEDGSMSRAADRLGLAVVAATFTRSKSDESG